MFRICDRPRDERASENRIRRTYEGAEQRRTAGSASNASVWGSRVIQLPARPLPSVKHFVSQRGGSRAHARTHVTLFVPSSCFNSRRVPDTFRRVSKSRLSKCKMQMALGLFTFLCSWFMTMLLETLRLNRTRRSSTRHEERQKENVHSSNRINSTLAIFYILQNAFYVVITPWYGILRELISHRWGKTE